MMPTRRLGALPAPTGERRTRRAPSVGNSGRNYQTVG